MKKIYAMLVLLISATLLIAACGQKSSSSTAPTQPSTPSDNAPAYDNTPSTPSTPNTNVPVNTPDAVITDTTSTDTIYNPDVAVAAIPAEQKVCAANADCVPLPACHPMECINKQFTGQYTKPSTCTPGLVGRAAESPLDCSCANKVCRNENAII